MEEITVRQALELIVRKLNNISVPVGMLDSIGIPIRQSVNDIRVCIDAMNKAEAEHKAEAGPEQEGNADV